MNSTQEEIFQHCAQRICDNCLKGYNGTILAYGQTGSGKTFTLLGPNITKYSEIKNKDNFSVDINADLNQNNNIMDLIIDEIDNENKNSFKYDINDQGIGLLPRVIYYLFNDSQKNDTVDFTFEISYVEIYQETISDLLDPNREKCVQLRDIGTTIILDGLRKLKISSPKEAIKYIIQGNRLKH